MAHDDPRLNNLRLDTSDAGRLDQLARHRQRVQDLRQRGFEMDPDPDAEMDRLGLEMDLPIMLPDVSRVVEGEVQRAAEATPPLDVDADLSAFEDELGIDL